MSTETNHGKAPTAPTRGTPPWRYAIGMFGTSLPINLIRGSIIYFYVSVLGMDARIYAGVMVAYGIIDAIDNPIFGFLSDRTRTRWGRRRPYLIVGALVLLVASIALFAAPESIMASKGAALVIWFAVWVILCEIADTVINVNYGALLPELYPQEKRRATANSLRQGFQLVAMIISTAFTPMLARNILGCERTAEMCPEQNANLADGDAPILTCANAIKECPNPTNGFLLTAIIYAVLAAVIIVFMAVGVKESPQIEQEERPKVLATFIQILSSKYFWPIAIVGMCYGTAMGMLLNGLQMYAKYSLDFDGTKTTILSGVVIVFSIGFLYLWTLIVRRKGAAWTWRIALIACAIGFVPLYFVKGLIPAIIAGLLVAFGWAGMLATNDLITSRVVDADSARYGVHREAVYFSAFSLFQKIVGATAIMSLAMFSLSIFFGFVSGDEPGNADAAWRTYLSIYPAVLMAIGAVISRFIKVPGSDDSPDTPSVLAQTDDMAS